MPNATSIENGEIVQLCVIVALVRCSSALKAPMPATTAARSGAAAIATRSRARSTDTGSSTSESEDILPADDDAHAAKDGTPAIASKPRAACRTARRDTSEGGSSAMSVSNPSRRHVSIQTRRGAACVPAAASN